MGGQEGDYGVVLAHGVASDATNWEEQGQRIDEEGMVALAVEDSFPESLLASIDYLKEERGAQGVALVGANATPQGFKGSPTAGMIEEALTK